MKFGQIWICWLFFVYICSLRIFDILFNTLSATEIYREDMQLNACLNTFADSYCHCVRQFRKEKEKEIKIIKPKSIFHFGVVLSCMHSVNAIHAMHLFIPVFYCWRCTTFSCALFLALEMYYTILWRRTIKKRSNGFRVKCTELTEAICILKHSVNSTQFLFIVHAGCYKWLKSLP